MVKIYRVIRIESTGLRKCPYKRYLTKKVMSE